MEIGRDGEREGGRDGEREGGTDGEREGGGAEKGCSKSGGGNKLKQE